MFVYKFNLEPAPEGGYLIPSFIESGIIATNDADMFIGESSLDINDVRYVKLSGKEILEHFENVEVVAHLAPHYTEIEEAVALFYKAQEAEQYLRDTDWYVARFGETGKPIPEEVAANRAEARLLCDK